MAKARATADMTKGTEGFGIRRVHFAGLGLLVAVCLLPLALMGMGVDAASRTLQGGLMHTPLEWMVVCAALFVGLLAGYIGTYRRGKAAARALRRALRISENNQLALHEHAIVSIADIGGNITFVNDKFCAISGYSREELIGQNHRLIKSDEHTRDFYRDMWQTISKGEAWSGEIKNMTKNGDHYWVAATIVPFKDSDGKIEQYVGIRTDITAAKEAEQVAKAHACQIAKANRELEASAQEAMSMNADLQEANKELARAMAEIREAASIDKLTGLANRRVFLDRLDSAIVSSSGEEGDNNRFAVLFFDFDRFKVVNDSLGHDMGDALLRDIADIFGKYIRDGDTVARFGGDEFVVLLMNLSEWSDARLIAEELLSAFALPHYLSNHQIVSTASIGLVTNEHRYTCSGDMIRDADAAMYEAKENGKERVVAFDSEMHARAIDRLSLESDLRYAISMKQLRLVYQPIISLETGDLSGFEALLRWEHPKRGLVSPVEFIPIAEDTGMIIEIGEWVMRTGAMQITDWNNRLGPDLALTLNVNVSKRQLLDPSFLRIALELQHKLELRSGELKLEITESIIADNRSNVIPLLRELRGHGFPIVLDDFGTGLSSLSTLHEFPIDVLKIDQAFIRVLDQNRSLLAVVASITTLADNLGIRTVAEGVETTDIVGALQSINCTWAQGYYFARPLSREDAEAYILKKQAESRAA